MNQVSNTQEKKNLQIQLWKMKYSSVESREVKMSEVYNIHKERPINL